MAPPKPLSSSLGLGIALLFKKLDDITLAFDPSMKIAPPF